MGAAYLILRGIEGVVRGEEYHVELGENIVLGRSSKCDICLKYLTENHPDREFNTISREHLRIHFPHTERIELQDLSSNGTFLNGKAMERHIISDAKTNQYELQLGTKEKFLLILKQS